MDEGEWELLIIWKYLPEYEATWDLMSMIQHQFPDFYHEDKYWVAGPVQLGLSLFCM